MRVTLEGASKGRHGEVLAPTSCVLETGRVTVVATDTEQGPSVLSLVLAGRMAPTSGEIHADGGHSRRRLRRATALIDTPSVCEPAPTVTLRTVVAEELLFARLPAGPLAVGRWLDEHGLRELGDRTMMHIPGFTRLQALTELALLRPRIEAVVLTSPERFGTEVRELVGYAREVAARGFAVAIVCGETTARLAEPLLGELAAPVLASPAAAAPSIAAPSRSPFGPAPAEAREDPAAEAVAAQAGGWTEARVEVERELAAADAAEPAGVGSGRDPGAEEPAADLPRERSSLERAAAAADLPEARLAATADPAAAPDASGPAPDSARAPHHAPRHLR
ncbi:hypothetical protein USB125703_00615 [Pseudoclavibacter triregionum]|nr:hypothetical protein USB125703_00615 [Pseudoclavibacter triregionum]